MLRLMPAKAKKNEQGIIGVIVVMLLLAAGIILGVYLVQNKTNLFSKASLSQPLQPETSFTIQTQSYVKTGDQFKANVMVRSDVDASNVFAAKINYPADKLEVVDIITSGPSEGTGGVRITGDAPEEKSLVSTLLGYVSGIVRAQQAITLKGFAECVGGKPVVKLDFNDTGDTYTVESNPVMVPNQIPGRLTYRPGGYVTITDFFKPGPQINTNYTIYIQATNGTKSNTITVITPVSCSVATPTPTPVPPTPTLYPTPVVTPAPPRPTDRPGPTVVGTAKPDTNPYFITKWIDKADNKAGTITLTGAVPNPGFKSQITNPALMATIVFKAKTNGVSEISFGENSAIYRNSDNLNILNTRRSGVIKADGSVVCKEGVNSFKVDEECGSGQYRYMYYECYDGYSGKEGGPTSCKPSDVWAGYAKQRCVGRNSCQRYSPTPSAMPTGTPIASPSATPKPLDPTKADLNKDSVVNNQDLSVFYSKCAEKGVELFGKPASVQPICDINGDGVINTPDFSILVKFRKS